MCSCCHLESKYLYCFNAKSFTNGFSQIYIPHLAKGIKLVVFRKTKNNQGKEDIVEYSIRQDLVY